MRANRISLMDLTLEELKKELEKMGEPSYRAQQAFGWIYKKGATSIEQFTDLPKVLREKLGKLFSFESLDLTERLVSADKTEKFLFRLSDGNFIETVLIPAGKRMTLCLSTQVGCKFSCVLCASGMAGFKRNLHPAEILGQVVFLRDTLDIPLTNFVFMGMGEPLDNYENVVKAIRIMNDPQGLGIAARRITISTAGVIPGIERLESIGLQVNLSLSLHAARPELRSKLMPINRKYPLEKLLQACEEYVRISGRKMTLEYILIHEVNDSAQDARGLAAVAKRLRAKVNLIPYSVTCGAGYEPSSEESTERFLQTLEERGVKATLRGSKGADIQAACGQLAGKS